MNPVSLCMIVKNEGKNIEKLLQSVKPWINDIVIVDTGSSDKTPEICQKYANTFLVFEECNDENGDILDFSMARNKSLSLAKNNIIMWADGDDIIDGLENLSKYVEKYKNIEICHFIQAPYHYSFDENGKPTLVHYRERILFGHANNWAFVNNVHEVCMSKPGIHATSETIDDIVWKHQRQYIDKKVKPDRNLRILQKWIDENGEDKDARQLYYVGLEHGNIGNTEKSRYYLEKYISRSGWGDERVMALLRLMIYTMSEQNYEGTIDLALRAIRIKPEWAESYFEAAKACYSLANEGKNEFENWHKCVQYAKIGLSLPPTQTVLFVNPLERDIIIHRYLNFALNKLGDIPSALDSVEKALKVEPQDPALLGNKKIYEQELTKRQLTELIGKYKDLEGVSDSQVEQLFKILNGEASSELSWKPYHRPVGYPANVEASDFPVPIVSPHSQAWAIPNDQVITDDLPLMMTDAQLLNLTIAIWKEYLLNDELISAISFLENAPTKVRHTDQIERLLKKTKGMTEWIANTEEYSLKNTALDANDQPFTTELSPLGFPLSGDGQIRLNLLNDRMPKKAKYILDAGPNDGFLTNRLALQHKDKKFVGVDGSNIAIGVANEAAERHQTGAEFIYSFFNEIGNKLDEYGENGKFDVCMSSDVYEHLPNAVDHLLKPMYNHLKDDGKLILTAPHQALFGAKFVPWADPWRDGNVRNRSWTDTPIRAHIKAPTVWSTMKDLEATGFYVSDCFRYAFPEYCRFTETHAQLVAEAYKKFPAGYDKGKKIVFGIGNGLENWDPNSISIAGIGGSEYMGHLASKELAKLGNRVSVYNSCGLLQEGRYAGVDYRVSEKFHDIDCDILIVSRYAYMFDDNLNIKAKKKILWVHDVVPVGLTEEIYNKIDCIFVLSQWHKENIQQNLPFVKDEKIFITSNGIEAKFFDIEVPRNQYKAISASSPDRYLPALLKAIPAIKKRVPQAEFHIFYSFFNWKRVAELNGNQNDLQTIASLEKRLQEMESLGVKHHGRVAQWELGQEFASSGVWLYPTDFTETNCLTAQNAQLAGTLMITSPVAALNEIAGERATMIAGDPMSDEYQKKFIEATVEAMKNPDEAHRNALRRYARDHFEIGKVIEGWSRKFDEMFKQPAWLEDVLKDNSATFLEKII